MILNTTNLQRTNHFQPTVISRIPCFSYTQYQHAIIFRIEVEINVEKKWFTTKEMLSTKRLPTRKSTQSPIALVRFSSQILSYKDQIITSSKTIIILN